MSGVDQARLVGVLAGTPPALILSVGSRRVECAPECLWTESGVTRWITGSEIHRRRTLRSPHWTLMARQNELTWSDDGSAAGLFGVRAEFGVFADCGLDRVRIVGGDERANESTEIEDETNLLLRSSRVQACPVTRGLAVPQIRPFPVKAPISTRCTERMDRYGMRLVSHGK